MGQSTFDTKRDSTPLADMASTTWRIYFLAACILVAGTVLSITVGIMDLREDRSEDRGKIIYSVAILRAQLESRVRSTFDVTEGIAQLISVDGKIKDEHFLGMAEQAAMLQPQIIRILLAPGDIVRRVFPVSGNEAVLGMDMLKIENYHTALSRARESKKPLLEGPVELSLKRGVGFIYRRPVFVLFSDGYEQYWGSVSVVVNMQQLLSPVDKDNLSNLDIALRGVDGLGAQGDMILGEKSIFNKKPVFTTINIPGGEWQLGVIPKGGWPIRYVFDSILFQIAFICTLFLTWFAVQLIRSHRTVRQRHTELAKEIEIRRVAEASLIQSEERFRALFERSPDPIWILRRGGVCTQANSAAMDVFGFYDESQFHTIGATDLSPPVQSDGQPTQIKAREMILTAVRHGVHRFEWLHKRADGTLFPAEITLCAFNLSEEQMLYAVVRDISDRKEAERALSEHQTLLQNIVDNAPALIFIFDTEGKLKLCNRLYEKVVGFKFEEIVGKSRDSFLSADEARVLQRNDRKVLSSSGILRFEDSFKRNGETRYYLTTKCLLRDAEGKPTGVLGISTDITETKHNNEQLRLSDVVLRHTADGVIITNARGHIISVNAAYSKITGYSDKCSLGLKPHILISETQNNAFYRQILSCLNAVGFWRGELWNRRKSGELYPMWMTINTVRNNKGKLTNYVAVFSDISEINQSQAELEKMSYYDPLTTLPNRSFFKKQLLHAIDLSRRDNHNVAVIILDLDDFKTINDSLGHSIGDLLLQQAAARFQSCINKDDVVSRLGGDEFAFIINNISVASDVIVVAKKLLSSFNEPFSIIGARVLLTASIGISLAPQDAETPEQLLKQADAAMYGAKESGRDTYRFYQPEMTQLAQYKLDNEYALRRAVRNNEFEVWYQPKLNLATNRLEGAEALIRWRDPNRGLVSPVDFIPLAEKTGLIVQIGEYVIEQVIKDLSRWREINIPCGLIAINVAALQIERSNLCETIKGMLEEYDVPANCLEVELTESLMMTNPQHTKEVLRELQNLGLTTAIDDFGTGHSSLAYLKNLPVNSLKIDRAFISGLPHDQVDVAIIKTIVNLGHALGYKLVAEGVETYEQHIFLKRVGCDQGQGYFYGKPMLVRDFESYYKKKSMELADS